MRSAKVILATAIVSMAATAGAAACEPPKCKTTVFKYDHSTGPVTWFTLTNEMRFCYDGTNATGIEWTDNRTSSPTFPYGRGGVSTTKLVETYEGTKRRARNLSRHSITCARVVSGFDVTMRQLGYGSGSVTKWRSTISDATNC
jgi:hypothetical protein